MTCPNCQTELYKNPETGYYTCPNCNATFKPKAPVSQPAPVVTQDYSKDTESYGEPAYNAKVKPAKKVKEKKVSAPKDPKKVKLVKILAIVLAVVIVIVTVVPVCTFFIGLRGVYVNINDSNDFISFSPIKVITGEWSISTDSAYLYTEKGTWKKSNGKINMTFKQDNMKYVQSAEYKELEDGYIEIGGEIYKKVSKVNYNDIVKKVNIEFDPNGGTCDDNYLSQEFKMGNPVKNIKVDPERTGYTFVGWYKDPLLRDGVFKATKAAWEDATYYAAWAGNGVDTFTITLKNEFDQILGYYPVEKGADIKSAIGATYGTYVKQDSTMLTPYDLCTSNMTIVKHEYSDSTSVLAATSIISMTKTAISTYVSNDYDEMYSLSEYFGFIDKIYTLYRQQYNGININYDYVTTAKQTINASVVNNIVSSGVISSMYSFENAYTYSFTFSSKGNYYSMTMNKDYNLMIDYSFTVKCGSNSVTCAYDSQRDSNYQYVINA